MESLALLTPYAGQVDVLTDLVANLPEDMQRRISVSSVDAFQVCSPWSAKPQSWLPICEGWLPDLEGLKPHAAERHSSWRSGIPCRSNMNSSSWTSVFAKP